LFSQVKIKSQSPTAGAKFIELLRDVSIPQNDVVLFCKFHNNLIDCSKLFKEVITDEGICYSMNLLNASEIFTQNEHRSEDSKSESMWDLKNGYKDKKEFDVFPKRALSNYLFGLNVVLSLKTSDLDFMCKGPVQGFKVKIHSPNDFPQISEGFLRVPLNEEVIVGLKPEITSDETKFDGTCHTQESKSLKYFKSYSQQNCLDECRSKYVQKSCDCVKFNMPHDTDAKICTQHDTTCIVNAIDKFSTTERFESDFPCDCRPSCVNLKYDTEITSAVFNFKNVFDAYDTSLDSEFPQAVMSRLSVYFKEDHYTLKKLTDVKQPWSEVAAKIGGIFALFMGASVISFIEVFYWFLRRVFN
jgi:amiloride-sensitive sodium channel